LVGGAKRGEEGRNNFEIACLVQFVEGLESRANFLNKLISTF
jgi:hypothetical protein